MALKRRNAEASKDAAVRFSLCSVQLSISPTNTLSGRVRQHPPQACCRGQEPAAGDEEAPCFFHAQVNLPSHRKIGWVKHKAQQTTRQKTSSLAMSRSRVMSTAIRLRGSREMVVTGMCNEQERGHHKSVWEFVFLQCSYEHSKGLSKNFENFLHQCSKTPLELCRSIPPTGFLLCNNLDLPLPLYVM